MKFNNKLIMIRQVTICSSVLLKLRHFLSDFNQTAIELFLKSSFKTIFIQDCTFFYSSELNYIYANKTFSSHKVAHKKLDIQDEWKSA